MYLFKERADNSFVRVAVSDRRLCERPLAEQVKRLADKADLFILREKDLPDEEYRTLAMEVQSACRTYGLPLSVNSRTEIASKLGITNIHLPFPQFMDEISEPFMTTASTRLSEHTSVKHAFTMIGVSVHSVEEAVSAAANGADYVIAGHIFQTDCKKDVPPRGTDFLRKVCRACSIPVYAIGGINEENVSEILACGAAGACQMSSYMKL